MTIQNILYITLPGLIKQKTNLGMIFAIKELVEKNGDVYKGHIKEYKVKGYGNTFCLTEDGRWFDNIGFECNVPSGFEHIKKVWEVKNEARKIREENKYNEYKNKMFKKGAR